MKQHEREYFVAIIRSGIVLVREKGKILKIECPDIFTLLEAEEIAAEAYDDAYKEGMMGEEEMLEWMISKGLWCWEDDERVKGLTEEIERLKKDIFNSRTNVKRVQQLRACIRLGEQQHADMINKRDEYTNFCREGMATMARWQWLVANCTTLGGEKYDFDNGDIELAGVLSVYKESILSQPQIREIARTDPWKGLWTTKDYGIKLFLNDDRDPSSNQQNLLVWSMMYDNIQESMDCPMQSVIEDDDMLDGWFILQREKREKDREEKAFEEGTKNEKIKNSDEIFVMSDQENAKNIMSMNAVGGKVAIRQREAIMRKNQGKATGQNEFLDEKLKMGGQRHDMYKGKFGR